jgi:hypothetical protein
MATIVINGVEVIVPDDMPQEDLKQFLGNATSATGASPKAPAEGASTFIPTPREKGGSIDPSTLARDKDWLAASRILYQRSNGKDFEGSEADLAEYGLDQMGWFNYNLPAMAVDAAKIRQADETHKQAFLYLMETYDDLQISWGGAGRFIKGVAADPTTYIGLGTLGLGAGAGTATKLASKEAMRAMLRAGAVGAVEGGVYGAVTDQIRQDVEVSTGRRTETDGMQTLGAAAIGAGVGAVAGGALDAAGTLLRGARANRAADEALQAAPSPQATTPAQAAPTPPTASVAPANAAPTPPPTQAAPTPPQAPQQLDLFGPPPASQPPSNPVIEAIRAVANPTGGRDIPNPYGRGAPEVQPAIQKLLQTDAKDVQLAVEEVRRMAGSPEERAMVDVAVREATRRLDEQGIALMEDFKKAVKANDAQAVIQLREKLEEIDIMRSKIKPADTELSSNQGKMLGARANNKLFNTNENRGLEAEHFLREKGIDPAKATPEEWDKARLDYYKAYDEYMNKAAAQEEAKALEREINSLWDAGRHSEAQVKVKQLRDLKDKWAEKDSDGLIKASLNSALRKTNEYVISTVFTPATITVNFLPSLVKTTLRPFLDYIVRGGPFNEFAGRQMVATYSAMAHSVGSALKAARMAFKYERAFLSDDGMRLLEDELGPAIQGMKGRIIRIFPRILNATDEFFSQVAYRGYVAGDAAAEGMRLAQAQGLKKKADIDALVKQTVEKRLSKSLLDLDTPRVLEFLQKEGEARGLSGPKLEHFVKTELDNNPDLFRVAADQSGVSYVDDLLFKRRFTGDNLPSRLAKGYERAVNEYPIMRLMGQLFFRTPVRVFEEGFRLTAGLNLFVPKFKDDLLGRNGPMRQVRAQGEALLSYAIAGSVMMLYAQGKISGGGPSDYKQRRTWEDGKVMEPYTIRFDDGSTFSFRNLDPFATPLKIITNALDRLAVVEYKKAQGEYVDKEYKEILGWISAGTASIFQAVRDASLTEGIDQIIKLGEALSDPEAKDTALVKFMGQKAQLAIPNVIQKAQAVNHPFMNDPVEFEDFLRVRINPGDPTVAKQYDALGNVRTVNNPVAGLLGVNITTQQQREYGKDPKALAVIRELSAIEIATGKKFYPPHKVADLPGVDLRTEPTADGRTTLYDRWQQIYAKSDVKDVLYSLLVEGKGIGGLGTQSADGLKSQIAADVITNFRNLAFQQLLFEEKQAFAKKMQSQQGKFDALIGRKEVGWQPYQQGTR